MPEFADSLFDQYPLPPMPEAQPSDLLGAFFGAAPDRTASYAKGLDAGSQYRLRSAQGEKALEEAHMQREQRMGEEIKNATLRKIQTDPTYQPTVSEMLAFSKGANDFAQARGGFQEQGFRDTLADPNAPQPQRFASGEAIQGEVLPQVQHLGPGREIGMLDQKPYTNPVGTADIAATKALEGERNRSPAGGTAGAGALNSKGEKAPAGYRWTAADDTQLEPMTGGPKDPNGGAPMGAREAVYLSRVIGGATQSVAAIKNMMQLPVGSSTGVFGVGAQPGASILQATRDALRNKVADQDTQSYNRMVLGLTRNLATIETQGLAPPGSFVDSFNNLSLRPGDTELSKLQAMAEMRQTVETGLEPMLNNPRVPDEQKAHARQLIAQLQQAVPFTWQDIIDLQAAQRTDPTATLASTAAAKHLGGQPPAAPGAAPTAGQTLPPLRHLSKSGKPMVSIDGGKTWEYE